MRPRSLTLRGFRSYADEVTFDFTGRSLVGIVGPIGSGKSSILDAVAFALYGKTPRIERDTKSLINQRRDSLHVSLTFVVDGSAWRVVRSLRRNGQSAHVLYRADDDGEHEVADRARDVSEQVQAALGLDFEAFRRSVLLAQNQFAQFLEATPVQRGSVLKGVFGFERLDTMREAAKRRLDAIGASLQVLAERRATAEGDRGALPGKQRDLAAATERASRLRELRAAVGEADDAIRSLEAAGAAAAASLAALDGLAGLIPAREDTEAVLRDAAGADAAVEEATAAVEAAREAATTARERHAAALGAAGGVAAIDEVAGLVSRLDAAREAAARARAVLLEAEAAVEAAASAAAASAEAHTAAVEAAARSVAAAEEAGAAEMEARQTLHDGHAADRARSLRAGLAAGEPCPVCEQVVATVPALGPGVPLDDLEAAAVAATTSTADAREAAAAARAAVATAEAELAAAARRGEETKARRDGAVEDLGAAEESRDRLEAMVTERLGEGDPHERLAALRAGIAEAADAERAAVDAEAAARLALDEARTRGDAARAGLDRVRSDIAGLAGRLDVAVTVGDTADAVEAALRVVSDGWVERRAGAEQERERTHAALAESRQARAALLEAAGLQPGDDLVEVMTEADRTVTALATEVDLIEKRLADLDRLDEDEAALVEQAALLERLHTDLRPSGFLEYVLTERRRVLADLAGDHLEALTAGRYRFSDDGEFDMLDLSAAEGRRAPASLSGGETFLASLALALALAEIVGRQGGRLDAFFLDEGFGSLDPEHLDLAMDGVERLVTSGSGRLVVVVSHVEAMRDRIEDLIVLSRHPITDHTVVESGAAR